MDDLQIHIEHDTDASRFIARITGGGNALLTYDRPSPTVIDVKTTYVPIRMRGRGVASALMQTAVDYAREQGYRIVPTCSYAQTWFERHAEAQDIVER